MLNSEVQERLGIAIQALDNSTRKSKPEAVMAKIVLSSIKERSNSGNGIPGLRGLGLEDALTLAEEIIKNGTLNLRIDTKALSKSVSS